MQVDEKAWVSDACRELLTARTKYGQDRISQDQLDYGLAKISLEFLDDFRVKSIFEKPFEVRRFEGLKPDEIQKMTKAQFQKLQSDANAARQDWLKNKSFIAHVNSSNLMWLKTIKASLEKYNHPKLDEVQILINEHESKNQGF